MKNRKPGSGNTAILLNFLLNPYRVQMPSSKLHRVVGFHEPPYLPDQCKFQGNPETEKISEPIIMKSPRQTKVGGGNGWNVFQVVDDRGMMITI